MEFKRSLFSLLCLLLLCLCFPSADPVSAENTEQAYEQCLEADAEASFQCITRCADSSSQVSQENTSLCHNSCLHNDFMSSSTCLRILAMARGKAAS